MPQEVRTVRQPCVEGREEGENQAQALKKILARRASMYCPGKITDGLWEPGAGPWPLMQNRISSREVAS